MRLSTALNTGGDEIAATIAAGTGERAYLAALNMANQNPARILFRHTAGATKMLSKSRLPAELKRTGLESIRGEAGDALSPKLEPMVGIERSQRVRFALKTNA